MPGYKSLREILDEHKDYEGTNRRLNTENERLRADVIKWKRVARYDDLTGLMRRGTFETLVEKLVQRSKRNNMPLGYILVDIDHFKKVNDSYGHDIGDEVLREVAHLLNQGVRVSDVATRKYAGRQGGEEMVLVLPNTDLEGAKIVAERLRESIEKYFKDKKVKVTISAGVSSYLPSGDDKPGKVLEGLYKTADTKLYDAKNSGRNKVVY